MAQTEQFIEVEGHRLHTRWIDDSGQHATPLVFLHEGLGSIDLWRDFPGEVVAGSGNSALVYSRYGHGWSDTLEQPRTPDYMHREAQAVLPSLLEAFDVELPILIGHSDGASISIIHAGSGHPVAGLVLLAPHVFVESDGLASVRSVRASFPGSEMAEKMAKYHTNAEATFRGWAEIWLNPAFRIWNIEEYLGGIHCPVLLIQCHDDEYGSSAQLNAIESGVSGPVERLILPGASHSAHLEHPEVVTARVTEFIERIRSRG